MNIKITTTILVVAIMLTGCSSTVQILTEPSGADVEINGKSYGKTPVTTSLSNLAFNEYQVRLKKEGYREKYAKLEKEIKAGPLIGGIFLWPLLFWCYGPTEVQTYVLEKQ
jgi:hypothetical protein